MLHAGIIIGLVMLQGDLGSALVFIFIAVVMCFTQGLSIWYLLGGSAVTILAAPYLWKFLKPYQQMRILVGFNPESDPLGYGFQQILSKDAIASGAALGKGYMQSTVSPTIPYRTPHRHASPLQTGQSRFYRFPPVLLCGRQGSGTG